MKVKLSNIVLSAALCMFGIPNLIHAQEGEIDTKSENLPIVEKDSVPGIEEAAIETEIEQQDFLPLGPMPQLNISKLPLAEPTTEKELERPPVIIGEKTKMEEPQSNFSFNFIYHLFYKFKLGGQGSN